MGDSAIIDHFVPEPDRVKYRLFAFAGLRGYKIFKNILITYKSNILFVFVAVLIRMMMMMHHLHKHFSLQ